MKKLLIMIISLILLSVSYSYAHSNDITGTVSVIDAKNKKVTIKDIDGDSIVFAVVNSTEIEIAGKKRDYAKFTDLKVGQHVQIDFRSSGANKTKVAKEITIYLESIN